MSRRAIAAGTILALWFAGIAALAHRELFRGAGEELALAAQRVAPDAEYYAVSAGDRQVGWASSTIDTARTAIVVRDILVATRSEPPGSRLDVRVLATLSRGFRLRTFDVEVGDSAPTTLRGTLNSDSTLTLVTKTPGGRPDTTHTVAPGSLLLPTLVPIALALRGRPRVGQTYAFSVFDPLAGRPTTQSVAVRAESLFVVVDSAVLVTDRGRWTAAHVDTVRSWLLEPTGTDGALLRGWVDERGRVVDAGPVQSLTAHRTAYELAYENLRLENRAPGTPATAPNAPVHPNR